MSSLSWYDLRPWARALERATPQTTRKGWQVIYRNERLENKELFARLHCGKVGSFFGVGIIKSDNIEVTNTDLTSDDIDRAFMICKGDEL